MTRDEVMKRVIEAAREQYQQDGFVEIDDDAMPSIADPPGDGMYLQAWVWINFSDLDIVDHSDLKKLFSMHRKVKREHT